MSRVRQLIAECRTMIANERARLLLIEAEIDFAEKMLGHDMDFADYARKILDGADRDAD